MRKKLRRNLERTYASSQTTIRDFGYGLDPITIPHAYADQSDVEIVAFVASCFAYGSRKVFVPLIRSYVKRLGKHPASSLLEASNKDLRKFSEDFRYRFNDAEDLQALYTFLRKCLRGHSTLGSYFRNQFRKGSERPVLNMLENAAEGFRSTKLSGDRRVRDLRYASYLFPSPAQGSTCKRALMFTRWMVRKGEPDFGLWSWIKTSDLIVPLDTHLRQVAIRLNLLSENAPANLKTAIALTDSLREFDSADPVRFDYALYSLGADGESN